MNPLTVNPIIAICDARAAAREQAARRRSGRPDRAIHAARAARRALERSSAA
jgi:hypothetical protein